MNTALGYAEARVQGRLYRLAIGPASGHDRKQHNNTDLSKTCHASLSFHLSTWARTCAGAVPP